MFRNLRADEIECRIGAMKNKNRAEDGFSLLLYKDARCDMAILDETVGPFNWRREHKELKGVIYCGVSIYCPERDEWITKWDCGTESNTEAQKGESSDSFKRACFLWNLGRALYSAPFIWVKNYSKYEKFKVGAIEYDENNKICYLVILDGNGKTAFKYSNPTQSTKVSRTTENRPISKNISAEQYSILSALLKETDSDVIGFCKYYKIDEPSKLSVDDFRDAISRLESKRGNGVIFDDSKLPEPRKG